MAGKSNDTEKQIGNYRVISKLASGAFGSVYLGKHVVFTKRPVVAIKLLHAHLDSQEERDRFLQEAEWLEMLQHPHILPIVDAGVHEGFPYLVTEYASNGSLRDRINRLPLEPLPVEESLTILLQVEQALEYAHKQNIIHRDVTPGNILFNAKGEVLLADFGVATMLATASLKRTKNPIGTPPYMAPEQFQGVISKEIDQYALGCIAYELFTGHRPFTGNAAELMYKHINEVPIAPRQLKPDLPEHIEQAILKAMAKHRTDRHASISAFVIALKSESKTQPINDTANTREQSQPLHQTSMHSVQLSPLSQVTVSPAQTQPLPPEAVKPTRLLPPAATTPIPMLEPTLPPISPSTRSPQTGKTPMISTAHVPLAGGTSNRTIGGDAVHQTSNNVGVRATPLGSPPHKSGRRLFIALALVLLILVLIFGGIALAAPDTLGAFGNAVSHVVIVQRSVEEGKGGKEGAFSLEVREAIRANWPDRLRLG